MVNIKMVLCGKHVRDNNHIPHQKPSGLMRKLFDIFYCETKKNDNYISNLFYITLFTFNISYCD